MLAETDGIGAYFNSQANVTLYLTEFSSYHTGLFKSQWEKQQDRTASNAKRILSDVTSALESQDKAMLGFNPVGTSYATNKDLAQGIPDRVTKKYIHRFLLEGLTDMATEQGTASIEFAKAFHKDLSYDGKADGKGKADGQDAEVPITIGESKFPLSSDTYRKDLAAAYYKAATDNGVDSGLAQSQAEKFAHANPKLGEDNIFDTEGGKFDTEPPSIKLYNQEGSVVCQTGDSRAIEKGRSVEGECIFSGEIELELIVQDDLTPVKVTEKKVSWIDGQNKEHDAEINFFPTSGNSEQIKSFELKINSKLADYDGVKSFKIKVAAQDIYQTSKE